MLDRRKSDEVRSRQSLDGAGADGRREEGEVRWDIQTGVASPGQARGTVLEVRKTNNEKKLDLGVF